MLPMSSALGNSQDMEFKILINFIKEFKLFKKETKKELSELK